MNNPATGRGVAKEVPAPVWHDMGLAVNDLDRDALHDASARRG